MKMFPHVPGAGDRAYLERTDRRCHPAGPTKGAPPTAENSASTVSAVMPTATVAMKASDATVGIGVTALTVLALFSTVGGAPFVAPAG